MRLPEPSATLPWMEPSEAVRRHAGPGQPYVLLHSGLPDAAGGRVSYLALDARDILEGGDLEAWRNHPSAGDLPRFGFLSHECGHALGYAAPGIQTAPSPVPLPLLWWMQPRRVLRFDHATGSLTCHGAPPTRPLATTTSLAAPKVVALGSSLSRARYLQAAEAILHAIHAGRYYQANLTRKLFGLWDRAPAPVDVFARLCAISPAPYAALVSNGHWAILSSSMEELLAVDAANRLRSRPIKGSIARRDDPREDAAQRALLLGSAKDRAENLMIVDLMRNDLARHAIPGSVTVSALCALESYAQLHHLVSTVEAERNPQAGIPDIVLGCFPPGSMIGAPKHAAAQALHALEPSARGVYGGALGYVGCEDAALSVVIRTLVMQEDRFEFQVGGGIVADSWPEREWEECLFKARGLMQLLGLYEAQIAQV